MFLNLGVVSPLSSPFGVTALLLLLLLLFILLTFFGDANDDPSLLPLVLVSPIFGGVSSISNFIFCPTFTGAFNASFIHFCMLTGLLRAVPASVVVFVVVFSSSGVVVAACRDPSSLVKYVAIGVAYPLPVVSFLFRFDSDLLVVVGDGDNDAGMIEFAASLKKGGIEGFGVAMGNASERSRKAASVILDETNADDGAAVAIERFIL